MKRRLWPALAAPLLSAQAPASPMDLNGIMPDTRVRRNEPDPLEFARRHLKAPAAAQARERPR